jgi:hypothetical protein
LAAAKPTNRRGFGLGDQQRELSLLAWGEIAAASAPLKDQVEEAPALVRLEPADVLARE